MRVRILHFYPDLMNLYGSYANLAVLRRYLEGLGCGVEIVPVDPGAPAALAQADFLYMGAGTERRAEAAAADFRRFAGDLKDAAGDGTAMLFAGTAMELLGKSVTTVDGRTYDGAGLAEFTSEEGKIRRVGDVYGHTSLYPEAVVGFMNKCSVIRGVASPLLASVDMGWGNEGVRGAEGFHWKNVFASQLTGPLLVKNPRMLETVAAAVYAHRGQALPLERPRDDWAEKGYAVTEEQLRLRVQGN